MYKNMRHICQSLSQIFHKMSFYNEFTDRHFQYRIILMFRFYQHQCLRKPVRVKIFERKKKVSRYYEMVSRLFEKAPRYFEKLSRYYEKVPRYYEMASRLFEKVSRYFEKVSRYYEMVSRLFEKVARYFEKLSRYYEMVSRLFEKVPRYFEKDSRYYEKFPRYYEMASRLFEKVPRYFEKFSRYYAPNFEEVDGAYWFRVVRASVRASVRSRTMHGRVLKFHIWIPHGKIFDTLFFLSELPPFLELCPFRKNPNEI